MVQAAPDIPERRRANKAEAAAFFDVSLPTVDQWIRKGCPFAQKGDRGVPWVLDLLQVAQWRFTGVSAETEDNDPDQMTPSDRKAWYESETKRRDLQVRDRELIEAEEVERGIATAFATIAHAIRALRDNVERIASPPPEVLEVIERITDESLNALADQLAAMAPVTAEEQAE